MCQEEHYWKETSSDLNGVPTSYKCVECLLELVIPSRDKLARDYLKQKYGN